MLPLKQISSIFRWKKLICLIQRFFEQVILRALRAKNVLTCQRALRTYVLTYQRALRAYVVMCQRALSAYVITRQRALSAYVPMCLACVRAHMQTYHPQ